MQKLAVVHFPQINIDEIEQFREKHDPGWKIIPPHITVISPLSEISENNLIEHVESTIKNIAVFPIHLTGLLRTSDDHLFLQVQEGGAKIVDLYNKLYSGILSSFTPTDFSFEPHITLGYFKTKGDKFNKSLFDKAYEEAEGMNTDIYCNFDSLAIIKGDGLHPAITIKTVSL